MNTQPHPSEEIQESKPEEIFVQNVPDPIESNISQNESKPQELNESDKDESIQFLQNVNSNEKSFGHNKFQIEIDNQKHEIEILNKSNEDKDIKLQLFKSTIMNLQSQLTEQKHKIQDLENALSNVVPKDSLSEIETNYNKLLDDHVKLTEMHKSLQILVEDKNKCNVNLENSSQTLNSEISNLENELQQLKSRNDEQVRELGTSSKLLRDVENKLTLKETLHQNMEKEVSTLRDELLNYKNRFSESNAELIQHKHLVNELKDSLQRNEISYNDLIKQKLSIENELSNLNLSGNSRRTNRYNYTNRNRL